MAIKITEIADSFGELQEAVEKYGSGRKAAQALGIPQTTFRQWLANEKKGIPVGQKLKGKSTLYDKDGIPRLTWVKTTADAEAQRRMLMAAFAGIRDEIPKYKPITKPIQVEEDLLACYIMTDLHLGMLAEKQESGEDWNIDIAERTVRGWLQRTMSMAPNAKTGLFVQLGDMAHFDSLEPVTPANKHVLDADARAYTMVRAGVRLMRESINTLLHKHDNVHVIIADANHDPFGAVYLRELLTVAYENEPRVRIDDNPNTYYCFVWGENSLFFHHGHKRSIKDVSRVFAGMYREQYGRSKKSYAHIGHYHHTASNEDALMRAEIHPTLAAKDAYAARGGYLSQRAANTIIYDKKHGEVGRITVTPEMALE